MGNKISIVALALAALALGLVLSSKTHNSSSTSAKESAFERVMRTQTLRCGYAMWDPLIIKDPNSGKLSGIFYEYANALGEALQLKVEWAEEIGWGDIAIALQNGRIDAMCAGAWPNAARARQIDFVRPIAYNAIYAYVRADDHRFDGKIANINDPSVTVAIIDGETSSTIATNDFPQAKKVQLPQLASVSELFTNVATSKADVTFTDSGVAAEYDAHNPGKLRRVSTAPLRVFGDPLSIAQGEDRLRRMLDIATEELIQSGKIEKIISKYEKYPGTLVRVAPAYQENNAAVK